jgi:prophage tail gpP-like protein
MAVSTAVQIEIDSNRVGKTYRVYRFTEFNIDLDLETDADTFDFVLKNPDGIYTGLFSKFDSCRLKINNNDILEGNLDMVEYIGDDQDDYIRLTGRDLCWNLVDNDALPDTIENVQPKSYITNKCKEYGIKCVASSADRYDKLVIGCGESEISIMNNILLESRQRIWYIIDTLYSGNWDMNQSPKHVFVRYTNETGIPIKKIRLAEDGTEMKSEMKVYGSDSNGGYNLVGSSANNYMKKIGIKKRQTRRAYSENASSRYKEVANNDIRDTFRDNNELIIDVRLDNNNFYMPNTTAQVIDGRYGINNLFFIRKVQYTKSISQGSIATLTMILADPTFEKIWQSKGTSCTNLTSASKKL